MPNNNRPSHKPEMLNPNDIPVSNPNNISAVYANHLGVSATLTDFTIFFLEMGQLPGPNGPIQKQELKAAVTLPIMAAAGLSSVLQQILVAHAGKQSELQAMSKSGK